MEPVIKDVGVNCKGCHKNIPLNDYQEFDPTKSNRITFHSLPADYRLRCPECGHEAAYYTGDLVQFGA